MAAGGPSQGYDFTAYIRSEAFARLDEDDALLLEEMDLDVQRIVLAAREGVAEYFGRKAAQTAVDFVDRWQQEHVYPYRGEPKSPVEAAERQIFDVLALALNSYLPGFQKAPPKQRELALQLLRQSLQTGPEAVGTILREVLDLPAERQAEMSRLLLKTSLSAVIVASRLVADRLNFLRGLEILLFDPASKDALLERRQLHKILERETWVLGEQYNLTVSDRSLTEVLERHLELLRSGDDVGGRNRNGGGNGSASAHGTGGAVTLQDGSRCIVDLMLARRVPQADARRREHLIVELKRPSQKIDDQVLLQVKNYARAVAADERFHETGTRWVFWALSNKMSPSAEREANQAGRSAGLAYADGETAVEVWARTWGQVLEDCRVRLELYARELEYEADEASAMDYLHRTHEKYLPTHLRATDGEIENAGSVVLA
jgi:hypothetical protein